MSATDKFVQLLIVVPFLVLLSCYILLCAMWVGHYISGTYKVRNEIETKRNETKSTKTKRNEINEMKTK